MARRSEINAGADFLKSGSLLASPFDLPSFSTPTEFPVNLSKVTNEIGAPDLTGSSFICIDFGRMSSGSLITIRCAWLCAVSLMINEYSSKIADPESCFLDYSPFSKNVHV